MRSATAFRSVLPIVALVFPASGCFASYGLHERAREHNAAGIQRLSRGDLEAAAAAFRLALEYNARFAEPYNNLALVAIRRGDDDDAEELLRHALRLNADFAEAWTNLGAIRLRRGDPHGAVSALTEALAIDPGQDGARYDLVLAFLETDRAEAAWEHALRLDVSSPEDPAVHSMLAWTAVRLGRVDEALGWATRALSADPDAALAHLAAGVAFLRRGLAHKADRHLAEAAAAGPSPVAWLQLGFAMLDLGKWAVAEEAFERVLSADPDSSQARVGLGAAAAGRGDLERAENMLAETVQAGRVSPAAILLLATVQADRGRTEAARATTMRLLDESDDSAPSVRLAARTLLDSLRQPAAR